MEIIELRLEAVGQHRWNAVSGLLWMRSRAMEETSRRR
jgi:hypothetical protein